MYHGRTHQDAGGFRTEKVRVENATVLPPLSAGSRDVPMHIRGQKRSGKKKEGKEGRGFFWVARLPV
jgi:hypothetical protein